MLSSQTLAWVMLCKIHRGKLTYKISLSNYVAYPLALQQCMATGRT